MKKISNLVLITGATSGIGKASASLFAKKGHDLIITGRRQDRLEKLSTKLKQKYAIKVKTLCFDVRNFKAAKKAINSLKGKWSQIDILLNNAGLAKGFSSIEEGDLEHWETMIDTNLKGLLYMTRLVSPKMVKSKSGHIINICSTAGHGVYPKGNVYCATKHGVEALTRAMRIDLHSYNIRVSQVSPGHVEETEFAKVRFDGDVDRAKIYEDFNPLTSKDVANAIFYVASQPKHVNIQDIVLMGTQQADAMTINRSGRIYDK